MCDIKEQPPGKPWANTVNPGKPWANTVRTASQRKIMVDIVKDYDKDKYYRTQLAPLLRASVNLTCEKFKLFYGNDEQYYDNILMRNISVLRVPVSRGLTELPKIDHLWVAVDKGWKNRIDLSDKHSLYCRGMFYEYVNSRGKRNIGFQALSIKPQ